MAASLHPKHDHQHGSACGHTAIKHDGHTDYLHDGHLHHMGAKGVEEIIQIKLTAEENGALQKSSSSVRELVAVLGL